MQKIISISIALSLVFSAGTLSAEVKSGEKKLKIAVLGPVTGEGSDYTKEMLEGVKLAARQFNSSGGINGKSIELVVKDNKGDYYETKKAVNELVKDEVLAIIASPAGWSTFTPVTIANHYKTILMVVGTQRHIGRSGPYIFRNSLSDEVATEATVKYSCTELGLKRYAILTSMVDDEACLAVAGVFRRAIHNYKGEVVADACTDLDLNTKDTIKKLKADAKGPIDAVIFAGAPAKAAEILKEVRNQGINAPLIGSESLHQGEFLKLGGAAAEGSILYASFTPLFENQATSAFVKEYKMAAKTEPTSFSALGYDSFMLIAEATRKAGTTAPSKVRDELSKIKNYGGVSGTISIGDNGETVNTPHIIRVEKGSKGLEFRLKK